MSARRTRLEVLRLLGEREAEVGWLLSTDAPPGAQQTMHTLAGLGLVELADANTRAQLSVQAGRPLLWAARLSTAGHDVLSYLQAFPVSTVHADIPVEGETAVELRPSQMDALRVYVSLAPVLRTPPADGLVERVRRAYFDRPHNRWQLALTSEQIESVAYAFYLRGVSGSVAEANAFARKYGVAVKVDPSTGRPAAVRMP
ncbi:DUF6417 family protein [Streptomyces sp. NPDC048306]|uniref:DUF6417 family protein n=1 Tax=Streptomyces TaxID=1883 RepID=UPI0033DD687C